MRPSLVGKRFGKLLVISFAGSVDYHGIKQRAWNCICDCGKQRSAITANLNLGKTVSCGSHRGENLRAMLTTHGETRGRNPTMEYRIWHGIRQRCFDKGCRAYRYYGARGISLCERWGKFESFLEDVGRAPSAEHSIDRIDTNGNYEPSNVRWATKSEQGRNKRNSCVFLDTDGSIKHILDLSKEIGIKYQTLSKRMQTAKKKGLAITAELMRRPIR